MPEKDNMKSNDPLGDKFIEMMEDQGVKFVDCLVLEPEPNIHVARAWGKLEKRLGRSIVTKKNYLKGKNKEIEN